MSSLALSCIILLQKPSCCLYHCQQLDRGRSASQSSKKSYQCGLFGARLGSYLSMFILATNVELLQATDRTMTEAYELLKNIHFLNDPCSIQAYIKKRLSNTNLGAIINCINLTSASTTYAWLQKAQPNSAAVERLFSMLSKLLKKERNLKSSTSKIHVNVFQ